jgi:hypothetical protein
MIMQQNEDLMKIIEDVRNILIKTAIEKYEDASISGLCAEGAWEAAIDALRDLAPKNILSEIEIKNKS